MGWEALSLRDVAQRLGVSHQAPYKHFPSRDHILAGIVGRAYEEFAGELDRRARSEDHFEDLGDLDDGRKRRLGSVRRKIATWSRIGKQLSAGSALKSAFAALTAQRFSALFKTSMRAVSKDNQAFLHARLNLGGDPLKPYRAVVSRWVCPDIFKSQPVSVAKAKKAIADYKKAIGYPEGMAELSVFYCEEAIVFPA